MAKKKILYGKRARLALKSGVDQLANAVVTTLGPKGRNVAIDREWASPSVIHDGVTVAKEVDLPDEFENMGAQMVKEAASKTNDKAGDGTTTATLLTQIIVDRGFKELDKVGTSVNPMIMNKGMEQALEKVVEEIKSKAKVVKGKDIEKVATISAQDKEIGRLVAEAITRVGKDGVVTAEEGASTEMSVIYREGMEFEKGYLSNYFVTDKDKMECELVNPAILITDAKMTDIEKLEKILEIPLKAGNKNIVIICDDMDQENLAMLVVNQLRKVFNVLAVKAPGFGDRKRDMLEDIAILTGGTLISESLGRSLDTLTYEDFGTADSVWADKENTRIIGGKGDKTAIADRVEELRTIVSHTTADFDLEKVQERLAKLSSGVAAISVAANSEVEMKEKKERVIDAIAATKAALDEGIVPGGGVTLFRAADIIDKMKFETEDEKIGAKILSAALREPLLQIAENAGLDPKAVFARVSKETGDYGLNVLNLAYGSMLEQEIVDPAKVTRLAVENAVSVGMMILTTECLMSNIHEKQEDKYAR